MFRKNGIFPDGNFSIKLYSRGFLFLFFFIVLFFLDIGFMVS